MVDAAVIGAGPAGLAAASAAAQQGASVVLIERDFRLGGILPQCIHTGFGLHRWNRELTGPEYADIDIMEVSSSTVTTMLSTFVTSITREGKGFLIETARKGRIECISASSVVLAMGCRERTAGAISLPGTRPAGVFTAGTAQRLMNMQNIRLGKRAVIIGSGDIGLIMARRLTLEGTEVAAVTEIMDYPGGLTRNVHQCLEDYSIPLHLSTPVEEIIGTDRVEAVRIPGKTIPCDTVLLSVGLIPENELSRTMGISLDPASGGAYVNQDCMTDIPGIFACGNVLHVHDVADFVSEEAQTAGRAAAAWAAEGSSASGIPSPVTCSDEFKYVLPQRITRTGKHLFSFRAAFPLENTKVRITQRGKVITSKRFMKLMPSEMVRLHGEVKTGLPVEVHCE